MFKLIFCVFIGLLVVGCASTPEQIEKREQVERNIETILTQASDTGEYGQTKNCLSPSEYRDFRALDDRYLLFEGSHNRLWINKLFARCPDLRHATVLRVKSISSVGRICKMDSFQPGDWFDWPWYRRAPWRWGTSWRGTMMSCSLGTFQAVTPAQVAALEKAIKSR
jgi:uncharacterized protein DUF6491